MADKKISALTALAQGDVVVSTDVLPIVDTSATETKKIAVNALVGAAAAAGLTNVDINSGTIDGTTIATSDITVGSGKTLNVSAGTLTLADNQISGDKVEGGTINAITINTLTSTAVNATTVDATNVEVTNIKAKDGTAAATIADSTGIVSLSANPILSGGTANGVLYLNGSKVATSGSALTFDGTTLGVNTGVVAGTALSLTGNYVASGSVAFINFQRVGGAVAGTLGYDDANIAIRFGTTTNHSTIFLQNNSEAMRLTTTGLGIGTSSPAYKLDVQTSAGRFQVQNYGAGSVLLYSNGALAYNAATTRHEWQVAGSSLMQLEASGSLGLGVTPSAWSGATGLQVLNASLYAAGNIIGFAGNSYLGDAGANDKYIANGTAVKYLGNVSGDHRWYVAASGTAGNTISFTQAMTLDANGDMQLGTTSVDGRLHVKSRASTSYGALNATTQGWAWLKLAAADTAYGYIGQASGLSSGSNTDLGVRSENNLTFYSGGSTERMRLDSSGNLGLGVTPSAWGTSVVKAFQVGAGSAFVAGRTDGFSDRQLFTGVNTYFNGTNWVYSASSLAASRYYQFDGQHIWDTAPSGTAGNNITFTQAMTLDASGRLGIGETSPTYNLDVKSNGRVRQVATTGTDSALWQSSNTGGSMYLGLENSTGSLFTTVGYAGVVWHAGNYPIAFGTNNTERARITSGGDLLVGTTTSGGKLSVVGTSVSSPLGYYRDEGTPTGNMFVISSNAYGSSFVVNSSGNLLSPTVYSATVGGTNRDVYVDNTGLIGYVSSIRASKTNIQNINDTSWLLQLAPVSFNYRKKDEEGKYTNEADGPVEFGLIAEDVEAVKPELCFYDEVDGEQKLRGISYSKLITPMLKLIQEQQAMINELKAKVAALETK